jgi:hypothetical protein
MLARAQLFNSWGRSIVSVVRSTLAVKANGATDEHTES